MDPSPVFTNVETKQIEIIWKIFILLSNIFFIFYIFLITFICRNMLTLYLKFKNIVSVSELGSRIFWVHHKVQARLTNLYSRTEKTKIIIYRLMNVMWACVHSVFDIIVKLFVAVYKLPNNSATLAYRSSIIADNAQYNPIDLRWY